MLLSCNKCVFGLQPIFHTIEQVLLVTQEYESSQRELGTKFMPRFDEKGLLTAVAQDSQTGEILMLAFMNHEALERTRQTGTAHFYSRSRQRLWQKGESSGNLLHVERILVDCDQDALVLIVRPEGPACHTGERSCFYRELRDGALHRIVGDD